MDGENGNRMTAAAELFRYLVMVRIADAEHTLALGQAEKDRAAYEAVYGAGSTTDGTPIYSPAKIVRFLVEVCGVSYNDALASVIDDMRSQPSGGRLAPDPVKEAQDICLSSGNIIESLFNLKVVRLAEAGDPEAVNYAAEVSRALMNMSKADLAGSGPSQSNP